MRSICPHSATLSYSPLDHPPAAAAADDDDDDDDDETMRLLTKFGKATRRLHQRTPGLRTLPLPSLVIIASVAFGNAVIWAIAGVVLVNTNTFFLSLQCAVGETGEWRV
ncbi:hypothetical protein MMC31_005204 [Peltigera leucophlebia]|nr:hypothetical protein [Peltigera leucophlebia]